MTDQSVIFILSNDNNPVMSQIILQTQQHSLEKMQVPRDPVKKVSKLLQKNQYTAEDLMGLSWLLFEESH